MTQTVMCCEARGRVAARRCTGRIALGAISDRTLGRTQMFSRKEEEVKWPYLQKTCRVFQDLCKLQRMTNQRFFHEWIKCYSHRPNYFHIWLQWREPLAAQELVRLINMSEQSRHALVNFRPIGNMLARLANPAAWIKFPPSTQSRAVRSLHRSKQCPTLKDNSRATQTLP